MGRTLAQAVWGLCVCLISMATFGQNLQAVVGITTSTGSLCQDIQNSTTTVSASASCGWNDGSGDFASGSGTATAGYGFLQSYGTIAQTIVNNFAGTDTATQTGSSFTDYLTFPGLSTGAFLQATLSISGTASGDPSSSITADVYLNGSSYCMLEVVKGSCTTSIPVSPGDQVTISGSLGTDAIAGPGTDSATLNFNSKKMYGAQFGFALVDSAGHKINVPIVASSGTKYTSK